MNEINEYAKLLGSNGGKKSVQSRFKDKTKDEISAMMRSIRLTKLNKNNYDKQQDTLKNVPRPQVLKGRR